MLIMFMIMWEQWSLQLGTMTAGTDIHNAAELNRLETRIHSL